MAKIFRKLEFIIEQEDSECSLGFDLHRARETLESAGFTVRHSSNSPVDAPIIFPWQTTDNDTTVLPMIAYE